ncbi:hypothetical protein HanXRQr2_Chr05g0195771 [Helianthus annuus]|uniref:Uncharacterized protein n=1 Tax=Helianthus annuus TaxID=4232 RepID=A0A251UKZ9_HELAN|nr:hypothetical protein HanXRQr2_Chr05g0195761 [Helianthus annuus]KAF5804326.1 hypothetical protein HanXRQr2_Chr05g0195771 [Helianthus annuus]KAJ0921240.1 hypothetical protein HanPSC8_Chr05g0189231 [Helianthus annuus]KAJ0921241.1 hypothetical protein HanPSC8_Chr05g0189241 [Helianthus annuus]
MFVVLNKICIYWLKSCFKKCFTKNVDNLSCSVSWISQSFTRALLYKETQTQSMLTVKMLKNQVRMDLDTHSIINNVVAI